MKGVRLKIWGDYALFTRPESKAERMSYDVPTPSAARGILEAIHWKPAIRWEINRIHVLNPIVFDSIRRNEVGKKGPGVKGVKDTLAKGERIGFIFPTHAWGLPKGLDRILSSLQFSGYDDNNYCYMICTCGDDVGETARLWRRAVKGAGLHGDAAFSVAMPNTYVCLPGFDVDDTQTATRKLENA